MLSIRSLAVQPHSAAICRSQIQNGSSKRIEVFLPFIPIRRGAMRPDIRPSNLRAAAARAGAPGQLVAVIPALLGCPGLSFRLRQPLCVPESGCRPWVGVSSIVRMAQVIDVERFNLIFAPAQRLSPSRIDAEEIAVEVCDTEQVFGDVPDAVTFA